MENRQQTFDKSPEAAHMFREALQGWLFPSLEAELVALDDTHRASSGKCDEADGVALVGREGGGAGVGVAGGGRVAEGAAADDARGGV